MAYGERESIDEPRNEVEEILIRIWKQVLGIDQIGIKDNFFDLGWHSLRVIQVVTLSRAPIMKFKPLQGG